MLKPRNPKPLYRSHYIHNGPVNKRIAMFMREQPRLVGTPTDAELVSRPWENSHIHWFCSRNTARMLMNRMLEIRDSEEAWVEVRRAIDNIIRRIQAMSTVSFDNDIGHFNRFEPIVDLHSPFTIEWNRTWDSSKWYEDTGPRPARKPQPEDTRPRIVMPATGTAVLAQHKEEESPFPNPLPEDFEQTGRVSRTLYRCRSISDIPGVGPARCRTLMQRFQTVENLRQSNVQELTAIPGIGTKLAAAIMVSVTATVGGA
jgi:predicted flap endonuclease-1-like 5' DNA nuclease